MRCHPLAKKAKRKYDERQKGGKRIERHKHTRQPKQQNNRDAKLPDTEPISEATCKHHDRCGRTSADHINQTPVAVAQPVFSPNFTTEDRDKESLSEA